MRTISGPSRPTWAAAAILIGLAGGVTGAQEASYAPQSSAAPAATAPAPRTGFWPRRTASPGVRRVQATPEDMTPPAPPPPPAPPTPSASVPPGPGATEPVDYGRGSAPPVSEPGGPPVPSDNDLGTPRAEREGGGGEPTTAAAKEEGAAAGGEEAAEEAPAKDETKLLMNFLGIEDSPVKVYGWIQNSYTGNTNGVPNNAVNFGVNPNFLANRWMGNQYYLIFENALEQNDKVNFGFRVDNLFGNDWQFNHEHSTFDGSFKLNHFAGYDPAQYYAEVHLPILTKGGLDIKGGRWYSLVGYEVVPATGRPLLSVPMMFNYGQPFTHNGVISTLHVNDRINLYNGAVNGWDRNWNEHYKYSYIGGFSWTSKTGNTSFTMIVITGPNQYPNFPGNKTQIILPGNTEVLNPGFQAGRANLGYSTDNRTIFTNVLTQKWGKKLTQVLENDDAYEQNVPGIGVGGTSKNASWYSFGNWFLYTFNDKFTGVWRSEVFRDNSGVRTGFADTFYTQTLGFIYKPKPYLWVRPEARYDWAQFTHPYNNGTRRSQLTLAFDVILLF